MYTYTYIGIGEGAKRRCKYVRELSMDVARVLLGFRSLFGAGVEGGIQCAPKVGLFGQEHYGNVCVSRNTFLLKYTYGSFWFGCGEREQVCAQGGVIWSRTLCKVCWSICVSLATRFF